MSYQHNIGGDRINNRLVTIRKHFHMNQQEFGQRLGFAPSTISRWETGERSIPESAVLSICREFGVNEMWFRRGDGEPFRSVSQDDALNELIRTHFLNRPLDFRRELIMALLRFDPDGPVLKTTVWTKNVAQNFVACGSIRKRLIETYRKNGITIPYKTVTIDKQEPVNVNNLDTQSTDRPAKKRTKTK